MIYQKEKEEEERERERERERGGEKEGEREREAENEEERASCQIRQDSMHLCEVDDERAQRRRGRKTSGWMQAERRERGRERFQGS